MTAEITTQSSPPKEYIQDVCPLKPTQLLEDASSSRIPSTNAEVESSGPQESSERLGTLGQIDSEGHQELIFHPRKNVPLLHECLGNLSIFVLSVWWIVGCGCYIIISICLLLGYYKTAFVLFALAMYPKLFKVKAWPLFRWLMAKGFHPLDLYAKRGYTLIFQKGAYEAISRTNPAEFLAKSNQSGGNIPNANTSKSSEEEKNAILLSYHPHGVFPVNYYLSGACCEPLFRVNPNIRFLIASALYNAPLWKFLVSWLDKFDSAEKKSMTNLMEQRKDIALLPGGFEEATIYRYGVHRIYLKKRTGFIKYALKYGYTLIPVYTFGEELNYYNLPGFYKFRLWLNKFHIPGVVFWGKLAGLGFSSHKMVTIYGQPLKCPKIENPTSEQVHEYHDMYMSRVKTVFEENKARCGQPDAQLEIW